MGYAMVYSPCLNCGQTFGYNPNHVPSITYQGAKEPICKNCIDAENIRRSADPTLDLPIFDIHPNAYEPIDEVDL